MIVADSRILAPNGKPAMLEAIQNNWYEGSRWSPNRSWVWFPIQDAKRDLDRYTRYELNKHARYLYKNSCLIRGLIERLVSLIVGPGIDPVFKTGNDEWDAKFKKWWKRRSKNIHLGHKCSFKQYVRAMVRARLIDGESFTLKTFDETVTYQDLVQGLESDMVTGTGDKMTREPGLYVDGVILNRQGIPSQFKFRNVDTPYSWEDVIHHFTPNRFGQYRGETILAAAINTARDVDDILALEKQAVKEASSRKDIIKTATGEYDMEKMRDLRWGSGPVGQFPTIFSLPADDKVKTDYYNVKFGAEHVLLQTGDEYTPYVSERPGSAWQGFMEFLANTICISATIPPSVVLPIMIGGTDIRRDLSLAQRSIEPIQTDVQGELDEIVDYLEQGDVADGVLVGAPAERSRVWHYPAKIDVDRQTAQQDRADCQAGLMSHERYHARQGGDGQASDDQVILEAKRRKEKIKAAGFKDTAEFVQVLSLDPKLFMSKPGGEESPEPKTKED